MNATDWQDIASAPKEGVFLVYLEKSMMGSRVHAANWRPKMKTIGSVFNFDAPNPTHWMPLPGPPL